jgi:opacity protein-like surface antigen
MKKLFIILLVTIGTIFTINAQTKYGVQAGVNLANFTGDNEGSDMKVGFSVGFFAEFELADALIFQPAVLYSTQGAKWSEGSFKAEHKFDYINVPLMLKYKIAEKFYLEAGPQIGFLTSAKGESNYPGEMDEDLKDFVKSTDFSLNLGASFDLMDNIFVGARYTFGLSNINDDPDWDADIKNANILLSLGYRF